MLRAVMFVLIFALAIVFFVGVCLGNNDYETDNLEDYGVIPEVFMNTNELMQEAFDAFFPKTLLPDYQNARYHYKACGMTSEWTAEMYLEFTVEDDALFRDCVEAVAPMEWFTAFPHDGDYLEYVISDAYVRELSDENVMLMVRGDIQKVLIQPEERRLIFVALRALEAYHPTSTLTTYFDRFGIDPDIYGINVDD